MSLQFVLGPSGSGKSYNIYNKIIEESQANPRTNYILLVPEQASMELQRKMVSLHPLHGTMNIDVIGFNRLAYRVFDEINYTPANILEDFGKSMLLRQIAGEIKDELSIYGDSLEKPGFIDEVKSLMSELYQYDVSREKLRETLAELRNDEVRAKGLLYKKLADMEKIFESFEQRMKQEENSMVAEELIYRLAELVDASAYVRDSVIVMDGFTGFTPIQLNVIEKLLKRAQKTYVILTIDKAQYLKPSVKEHELFYLTRKTMSDLKRLAVKNSVPLENDIFIEQSVDRWTEKASDSGRELRHLEKNLFRYPYEKYPDEVCGINISYFDTPDRELKGVAAKIRSLVNNEGFRYKDIAVVCGNPEAVAGRVDRIFPQYDIPYFTDYSRPIKNNPFIDAIGHILRVIDEDYSYDSVFALLKSGVFSELTNDEIELLENAAIAKNLRGKRMWSRRLDDNVEEVREYFMEKMELFTGKLSKKDNKVSDYTNMLRAMCEGLEFEEKLEEHSKSLETGGKYSDAKLYSGLYEKICSVFDKLDEIMPEQEVSVKEFREIIDVGFKDLKAGLIPACLDMVIVGDITRTRLESVKVLFIINVNDGIIPKQSSPAQIISDREKEELAKLGLELAPTEKFNSYIEQFYLYINMTKPSKKLYLSYSMLSNTNEPMRPSYIIGRICNLYPKLRVIAGKSDTELAYTKVSSVEQYVKSLRGALNGDEDELMPAMSMYELYREDDQRELLDAIDRAFRYNNIPGRLSDEVEALVKLKIMSQSVSRLEKYAGCAYAYFLQYILGVRDREIREINNRDIGNILHGAMECMYRHVHDNMQNDWASIDDDTRGELVERFVRQSFVDNYGEEAFEDERYRYLFGVLVRIGKRTTGMLQRDEENAYSPTFFEQNFRTKYKTPSGGNEFDLNMVVDRADVIYSEEEKTVKLRIIDYKSGAYDFKINELYDGLQLQLSIYMNAMLEFADEFYNKGKKTSDRVKIIPEGMYYYRMEDPLVEASSEEDADKKREKELKLKGKENDNIKYFEDILKYAGKKAGAITEQILAGDIGKSPIKKERGLMCEYCPYDGICRFDSKYGKNSYRTLTYSNTKAGKEKAYQAIVRALGGDQNGMDRGTEEDN